MMFRFTYDIILFIFVQFLKSKFQASRSNVTAIRGETAMLVCKVINIGDKAVRKMLLMLMLLLTILVMFNMLMMMLVMLIITQGNQNNFNNINIGDKAMR